MAGNESHERRMYEEAEELRSIFELEPEKTKMQEEQVTPRAGYLVELSGQAISLEYLEFQILQFLSRRPYKAFTRKQICDAVRTVTHPIDETTIDNHVMSLRHKLGLFSDYVQSVPYVGYRFKE